MPIRDIGHWRVPLARKRNRRRRLRITSADCRFARLGLIIEDRAPTLAGYRRDQYNRHSAVRRSQIANRQFTANRQSAVGTATVVVPVSTRTVRQSSPRADAGAARGPSARPRSDRVLAQALVDGRSRIAMFTSSLCLNDRLSMLRCRSRPEIVDDEHLRVDHRRLVFVDADARFEQLPPHAPAGEPHPPLIGVAAGDDDADLHAARRHRHERAAERAVRQEVRRGDADGLVRAFDQQLERDARRGRAIGRRALDDERRRFAARMEVREMVASGENLAAALEPVLGGDALNRRHDRSTSAPSCRATDANGRPAARPTSPRRRRRPRTRRGRRQSAARGACGC